MELSARSQLPGVGEREEGDRSVIGGVLGSSSAWTPLKNGENLTAIQGKVYPICAPHREFFGTYVADILPFSLFKITEFFA